MTGTVRLPVEALLRDLDTALAAQALLATVHRVRALHHPVTRWHPPDCAEASWDTALDAAEWLCDGDDPTPEDVARMASFDICAECGRIETAAEQRDPGTEPIAYLNALWPCATARALRGHYRDHATEETR